ncbi:hypothetical protein [Kitasatospora sp. NPDC059800]|uniref:hypothetical protein n=1 Tax=Kitasatospora sp. NPDC059800 TaxID=3346951 RepID=UPI0036468E91
MKTFTCVAGLESGTTSISRVETGGIQHTSEHPWVTTYWVEGPRAHGTIEVAPSYRDFDGWHFMPTGLHLTYGTDQYAQYNGSLVVNGVPLAGSLELPANTPARWNTITIRRTLGPSSNSESTAPGATQRRAREILRATFEAHIANEQHAFERAAAYARHKRTERLESLRRAEAAARQEFDHAETELRVVTDRTLAMDFRFEQTLAACAPAAN